MGDGQRARRSQFDHLAPDAGSIVFLGDSITEGGLWEEWYPGAGVVNRGIGGETAPQVMTRLDVVANDPAAIFLLIGTNDLTLRYPVEEIAQNVRAIVERARALAPNAPIYLESVMPRGAKWRRKVLRLNDLLKRVAVQAGANYVDLWPALADEDGALRPEYTIDGLHLTGAGYRAWVAILQPVIAALRPA
ncbi:hypothetical protein KZX68_04960 [Microbacterium sp. EYE_80]|nr:hypothetical protein [Microbacterium sp. EYE_80]MCK6227417.1 hypothetical protein [Microbacterium sp. EYE_77]MCK6246501.1 hypothetical protein [Microbacterium sp. EYE_78]